MPQPLGDNPADATISLDEDLIDDVLYAARAGDLELLTECLSNPPSGISVVQLLHAVKDPNSGNTPLHYASANGHVDVLRHIIEHAKKIEPHALQLVAAVNNAQNTALHYAAVNGQLDAVKILVDAFPEVTMHDERMDFMQRKNEAGHDAAFEAETADKEDVVNWLLGQMDALEPLETAEDPQEEGAESSGPVEPKGEDDADTKDVRDKVAKVDLT